MQNEIKERVKTAKRIVVKVGTSTLTYANGNLNLNLMNKLAWILADKNRVAIPKTTNPKHLQSNLEAVKVTLTAEDIAQINTLSHRGGRKVSVPRYAPEWDDSPA